MALGANIRSIDALQSMRAAILNFLKEAEQSLAEVDAESQRVADWITHQQPSYWKLEKRKREKEVAQAKDDLRRVQLSISDHKPSAVEQKKALKKAQNRLEESRQKIEAVKRWGRAFQQAQHEYRGQIQQLMSAVDGDLPRSVSMLEKMIENIDAYLAVAPPPTAEDMNVVGASSDVESISMPTSQNKDQPTSTRTKAEQLHNRIRSLALSPDERTAIEVQRHLQMSDDLSNFAKQPIISIFDRFDSPREPARPGDVIVLEESALASDTVALQRTEAGSRDSGWLVIRLPEDDNSTLSLLIATTVSKFQLARPDLREVLALPVGYCAIINEGSLDHLYDSRNELCEEREA